MRRYLCRTAVVFAVAENQTAFMPLLRQKVIYIVLVAVGNDEYILAARVGNAAQCGGKSVVFACFKSLVFSADLPRAL